MPTTPPPATKLPHLNEAAYARWMKLAHLVSHAVGLDVRVKGETQNLARGHIFLFNHFTRFETTIPPMLMFKHTGAICRTITHHSLFGVHSKLTSFLYDGGCVPSDMHGLLPYLAGEILRGRKVVIFPEGGLVKDKKVFDDRGDYATNSGNGQGMRKHHRGAAVLATYLDILKAHLQDAQARADTATLAHWQATLGLPSQEALLAAIAEPTLVVPSTLTFFPIRSEPNVLVKMAEAVVGELPERVRDELTTETNLLLRPTDLDICIGQAIPSGWAPPKAESLLWRHALRHTSTLEDIFQLEFGDATWLNKPLHHRAESSINRLRDKAMRALYGGLTVNLHHLVAVLVMEYWVANRRQIPQAEFESAILFAAQRLRLQAASHTQLPLHESLSSASAMLALTKHQHPQYQRFMETLRKAKLVKLRGGVYYLSQRLSDELGVHEIRLENPVQLHENEAAIQPAVKLAAMWGMQQAAEVTTAAGQKQLAVLLLTLQQAAAQQAYTAAGAEALAAGAGALQPFLLKPVASQPAKTHAVLMLHGLGASPAQMRPLAEDLRSLGYTVHAPLLLGHGGKPADLSGVQAADWVKTAKLGLEVLQGFGFRDVQVVGFSTGALVALRLAKEQPAAITQIVAVAPPITLVSPLRHLLTMAHSLNLMVKHTLGALLPSLRGGVHPWYMMAPKFPAEQYAKVPLSAVVAMRRLAHQALAAAPSFKTPVTLLHGTADAVAQFASGQKLAALLGGPTKFVALEGAPHDVIRTNHHQSWAHVIQALEATHKANDA
jgi:pimeloyl-ACP methyl ester carboxylesterase/1-acyl-sn-glycerol-3-phosphate acyltransferase